ncbi:MAG TPA: IPT/TIG domain-containing protein [Gammaproteobacteria bacterium]
MTLTRTRRLLATLSILFAALCGPSIVHAANCSGSGSITIVLSPCPLSHIVRSGSSTGITVTVSADTPYPTSLFYAVVTGSTQIIKSGSFHAVFVNSKRITVDFSTPSTMSVGVHSGILQISICKDTKCAQQYSSTSLPYSLDVELPPSISSISPGTSQVGRAAFTMKLTGRFTPDCKVYLGNTALTTKFVSSSELTATVNVASVTRGQDYSITVEATSNGFSSNAMTFTLYNPVPKVTALTPATVTVGAAPFTLQVTGKGFVSNSKVMVGSTAVTTTYASSTVLKAQVDLSAATTGGTYAVSVKNPAPSGGASAALTLDLENAVPVITSISPSSEPVSAQSGQLVVFGTGFQPTSVVQLSGTPLNTTYISHTELVAGIPAGALASPAYLAVGVSTPAPGGGSSNTATLTAGEIAPFLFWVSPTHLYVGGNADQTLTLRVTQFSSNTLVEWNGTPLTVTRSSPAGNLLQGGGLVQVTVPSNLLTVGTATVKAVTPAPGGGSVSQAVAVSIQPPEIDSLSPGFVAPGGGDFTLTINGEDFDPSATVLWNGQQLTITLQSSTQIQATVRAAESASSGVASVAVVNPAATGGPSLPASFAVDSSGTAVVPLAQAVNDIAWDPSRAVIYGSIPSSDANKPNSIATIDPIAAGIVTASPIGISDWEPRLLSVSGDDSFIYVSVTQSAIVSLELPSFGLYQYFAIGSGITALQASPTIPHVFAANVVYSGFHTEQGYLWMDNLDLMIGVTPEPWDTLAWSADGTHLYAGDTFNSGNDLVAVDFDLLGSTQETTASTPGIWNGTQMHLDAASGLIYADNSTAVIDPTGPSITSAVYPVSGVMIPDSTLGCAYFITQTAAQITAAAGDWTLSCYNTTDQSLTRSLVIPSVTGTPTKMMHWGNEGLVFITDGGMIYFVSGQVVTGN